MQQPLFEMSNLPGGIRLSQQQKKSCVVKCAIEVLIFIAAFSLTTACASKKQYPVSTKVINAHEIKAEKDSPDRLANLSYEQLIRKGDAYLQSGNHQLASLHYQKALEKQPESMAASIGLSQTLYQTGKIDEATRMLETALESDPDNVSALLLLGVAKRQQGDLDASLARLTKAYELHPQDPEVLTELAITNDHIGQERLTYAEPLYRKVTQLKPNSAAAHNNLGFNYLLQGRQQDAIKSLTKALALAPDNDRAKNNLGAAYLLDKQPDRAIKLFQGTVGLAAAYNNLGYIYMTRGDLQSAEQAFKKALQLNPAFYVRAQQNLDILEQMNNSSY